MKKVLILGVASVQMDAIKLLKQQGYETHACAMAKDGPGADLADHFEIINILDIERIKDYILANNIDLIYSVGSDIAMPVVSKISEELSMPHFVTTEVATICNSKDKMRKSLGENCIGNIPFQVIEDIEDIPTLKLPFIMKPADSQGQRGIYLINSQKEFENHFHEVKKHSRSGKVIIEKYIQGQEVSVNAYLVEGKLRFMYTSDRETWAAYIGLIHKHIVPSKVINLNVLNLLEEVIEDACSQIGIQNGPAYFQVKVENDKPYIIEMTPRLDGCHMWKLLEYHTGQNILKLTFDHLINGDTSELDKKNLDLLDCELEFFCQEPNTIMEQNKFNIPSDTLEHFFYYENGDEIRPVNGKYDKVGYLIKSKVVR